MAPNFYKKSLFFCIIYMVFPFATLFAASESYIQTLSGKIKKGDSCVVIDDKFLQLSLEEWNQIKNLSVTNILSFELRQDTMMRYKVRVFSCTLDCSIKYFTSRDQEIPTEINNIKLTVSYDTATGKYYSINADYKFKDAFKVVLVVNSITSKEWGDKLPDIFRIKNQIFIERKYPFNPSVAIPIGLNQLNNFYNSDVEANIQAANRFYDYLQWVNDETPNYELQTSQLETNHKINGPHLDIADEIGNYDTYRNKTLKDTTYYNKINDSIIAQPYGIKLKISKDIIKDTLSNKSRVETLDQGLNTVNDKLLITWLSVQGADEYDVEWTYLDVFGAKGQALTNQPGVPSSTGLFNVQVPTNFLESWMKNDNSRVTVKNLAYSINLPYTSGYVLVRIRGVQYATNGTRLPGNWVYTYSNNNGATTYTMGLFINPHETNLNWQYTASFAEEGKRKEVISYFDASLRNRQSVTINNSDNKSVVAETIYDNMGRPAANILPAPTNDNTLKYFIAFNKPDVNPNIPYSYKNIRNSNCNVIPNPLSTSSGASQYYSSANPFINLPSFYFTKYVPDAEKLPISVTQYTPDNTGRIRKQGGVGKAFQIGTGHETKYYYGKPMQKELDRLFGMEVGNASHYLKNMVVDPNGQVSVSYIDANGKTIATALAGNPPKSLDKLNSSATAKTKLNQELLKSDDFTRDAGNLTIQSTATFLASVGGTFKISYAVNTAALTATKIDGVDFCATCYYDLTVVVRDECGTAVSTTNSAPFLISQINRNLPATSNITTGDINFQIDNIGEYSVTYTLQLSKDVIKAQEDYYILNNRDIRQLRSFFEEEIAKVDLSGCYSDCETCKTLGTEYDVNVTDGFYQKIITFLSKDKYKNAFVLPNPADNTNPINIWIADEWQKLKARCTALQPTCNISVSPCDVKLEMLKKDVLPDGQYAIYDVNTFLVPSTERSVSVILKYKTDVPNLSFIDENGQEKYTYDLSESEFIKAYILHPEWAKHFIKLHIEYCSYLWCTANSEIYAFDQKLRDHVNTAQEAIAINLFSLTDPVIILNNDPFFSANGIGYSYKTSMQTDLMNLSNTLKFIMKDANGTTLPGKNITEFIDWLLYCKPTTTTGNNTNDANALINSWTCSTIDASCRSRNREWEMYKQYYLQLKAKYEAMAKEAANPDCKNCFVGGDAFANANTCDIGLLSDYTIVQEGNVNGSTTVNFYLVYKNQTTQFPQDYQISWGLYKRLDNGLSGNLIGNISTTNVTKGATKVFIFSQTKDSGGVSIFSFIPLVTNVACKPSALANCVASSVNSPNFDCPTASEFYLLEVPKSSVASQIPPIDCFSQVNKPDPDDFLNTSSDVYYVHAGGPVSRPISIHIYNNTYSLEFVPQHTYAGYSSSHFVYNYSRDAGWVTIYPGSDRVKIGTNNRDYHWQIYTDYYSYFNSNQNQGLDCNQHQEYDYYENSYRVYNNGIVCPAYNPPPSSSCQSDTRYALYKNKTRVFNEYTNIDIVTNCSISNAPIFADEAAYNAAKQAKLQQVKDDAIVNLAALKEAWLNKLRAVVKEENEQDVLAGLTPRFTALEDGFNTTTQTVIVNATLQNLVNNLEKVAKENILRATTADEVKPASTLPVGVTASGTSYNSFGGVFTAIIGSTLMNKGFNQYLLESPYPHDKKPIATSPSISDLNGANAAICTNVFSLNPSDNSFNYRKTAGMTLHNFLKQELTDDYNLTEDELTDLQNKCSTTCNNRLLDNTILIPASFLGTGNNRWIDLSILNPKIFNFPYKSLETAPNSQKLYRVLLTNYLNAEFGYSLSYDEYIGFTNPMGLLYNKPGSPLIKNDDFACTANILNDAFNRAGQEYERYIVLEREKFRNSYVSTCIGNKVSVNLEAEQFEYHYTLYYYDQSGNLVKTIPPEGVTLLTDEQLIQLAVIKNAPTNCNGTGLPTSEDKITTLSQLSTAFTNGTAKSIEFWLNGTTDTRQVRFATPDNKYLYQLAIKDKRLWVEVYTLTPDMATGSTTIELSNQFYADISKVSPLQDWTHIVIETTNNGSLLDNNNPLKVYVDGILLSTLTNAAPYPFDWEITASPAGTYAVLPADDLASLKHLRAYNRLVSYAEVLANYQNACMAPTTSLATVSNPMLVWGRFNIPSSCSNNSSLQLVTAPPDGSLGFTAKLNNGGRILNNVTNNFTVEFWANPQSQKNTPAIHQGYNWKGFNEPYAIFPVYAPGALEAGMGIAVGTNGVGVFEHSASYITGSLIWDGTITGWTHIAVVYSNRIPYLYINGQFIKQGKASASKQFIHPSYDIGGGYYGYMGNGGKLDEIRIWNTVRSATEIFANYNKGLIPRATPGLEAYWPIKGGDLSILKDFSCNGHDLTVEQNNQTVTSTNNAPPNGYVYIEKATRFIVPDHYLPTNYAYNSLNQVIKQSTPDAGVSEYWYDVLGRLAASQNAEQKAPTVVNTDNPTNRYSYTKYDEYGRIKEVGEKIGSNTAINELAARDATSLTNWYNSGSNRQVTVTAYDEYVSWAPSTSILQTNLRKRVSATAILATGNNPAQNRVAASYYSYDISGNVHTLWQENKALKDIETAQVSGSNGIKEIKYEFDLVSGKVNRVKYQDGKWDQFYYQYIYDADNRLIDAYTTRNITPGQQYGNTAGWRNDASYRYYLHGPLARMELNKVNGAGALQGVDYAYTLQGWLKGVNGQFLQPGTDMSADGVNGTPFALVARDALAYTLGYYKDAAQNFNDYIPIGAGATAFAKQYNTPPPPATHNTETGKALYNGNISHSTYAIKSIDPLATPNFRYYGTTGYSYRYDQLNRLTAMNSHGIINNDASMWANAAIVNAYKEQITYDANGNIQTYLF